MATPVAQGAKQIIMKDGIPALVDVQEAPLLTAVETEAREERKKALNIMLGVPMSRTVYSDAVWSFIDLAARGFRFVKIPYQVPAQARNHMVRALLERPEFSHLLMLDDDHLHPIFLPDRLASWWVADESVKMVGALVFRRVPPFDPLAGIYDEEDGKHRHIMDWTGNLINVDYVATSACLIHRSIFEVIPPPWFETPHVPGNDYLLWTEDYFFCRKVRDAGIKIWLDSGIVSPHLVIGPVGLDAFSGFRDKHIADGEVETIKRDGMVAVGEQVSSIEQFRRNGPPEPSG